jgi:hypothetical protein
MFKFDLILGEVDFMMNNRKNSAVTKLAKVGEYGEDLYDFAKASQWRKADKFFNRLQKSYGSLDGSSVGIGLLARLRKQIGLLGEAIAKRNGCIPVLR